MTDHSVQPQLRARGLLALSCELALLVALATAGWQGADTVPARIGLAIALPGTALASWTVWTAPTSPRRLRRPGRLALQALLFILAGGALAATGHPLTGAVMAALGAPDVAVLATRDR